MPSVPLRSHACVSGFHSPCSAKYNKEPKTSMPRARLRTSKKIALMDLLRFRMMIMTASNRLASLKALTTRIKRIRLIKVPPAPVEDIACWKYHGKIADKSMRLHHCSANAITRRTTETLSIGSSLTMLSRSLSRSQISVRMYADNTKRMPYSKVKYMAQAKSIMSKMGLFWGMHEASKPSSPYKGHFVRISGNVDKTKLPVLMRIAVNITTDRILPRMLF
mmetsp:Transcript_100775/g.284191  ORF Transcript_100775/g.284191 Transcript_100775/m.284191 type:complete len:221 (+) Transcript_100775:1390-2052(+)